MSTSPTFFAHAAQFRAWLEANGAKQAELLVGFYKLDSGRASITWPESVDEALCFGWIDGVRKRIDALAYCIRFTPRKPSSVWSAVNIAKFAQLQASGKMTAAGALAYSHRVAAKSKIYAYEQDSIDGLSEAEKTQFCAVGTAWEFFQSTPASYQKVILHWLNSAKKAQTRADRFGKLLQASAQNKRL